MSEPFQVKLCDFDGMLQKVRQLLKQKDKWVFRGQKKAEWNLKTSLDRACELFGVEKGPNRTKIERSMIREFQRRLHHYTANVPNEDNIVEWMAFMQHHLAPTRLLDFTYSPYVAAYFAFEAAGSKSKVAIWAVNTDYCERQLKCQLPCLAEEYLLFQKFRKPHAFDTIFMACPPHKLTLSVSPFRLNERQAYQRGAFLCPGDATTSFMGNLTDFMGNQNLDQKIIKFVIPTGKKGEIRDDALDRLDDMNINRITLFPGLEGFAQSFSSRIPFFLKQRW
jgi:hypothetical protein